MNNKQKLKESLQELNDLKEKVQGLMPCEDKFAELKEAHRNGVEIQLNSIYNGWHDVEDKSDLWLPTYEYRIKPEENPKVGDVVKAWCKNEDHYVIGNLTDLNGYGDNNYGVNIVGVSDITNTIYYPNAKTLAKQEAIKLLFGKQETSLEDDIQSLKNKYPQCKITITVEDKV